MAPVKRALSSYMLFCNDRRKQVNEENPGLRIGEIQKIISAQWKELNEQEREHYVQLAVQDKERYAQERLANPVDAAATDAADATETDASNACIYQLSRVKRIMQTDPDACRVNRDALIAITKATELFVQLLATKGYEQALFQNRRTIRATDVTRAMHITSAFDWLRDDFPDVSASKTTTNTKSKRPSTAAAVIGVNGAATIADVRPRGVDFFKPQSVASNKHKSKAKEIEEADVVADDDVEEERMDEEDNDVATDDNVAMDNANDEHDKEEEETDDVA